MASKALLISAAALILIAFCTGPAVAQKTTPRTAEEFYTRGEDDLNHGDGSLIEVGRRELTIAYFLDPNGEWGQKARSQLRYHAPLYPVPKDAITAFAHALDLEFNKKYLESIKAYREIIAKHPFFEVAYANVGRLYGVTNDFANAERYSLAALKINPAFLNARSNLGWSKMFQKDYVSAKKYFDQVMALEPDNNGAVKGMAELQKRAGAKSAP